MSAWRPSVLGADRSGGRPVRQIAIAGGAIAGGAIVIVGAWMCWFSLFAGLQPYRGVDGLNGRLLAIGAALSVLGGVWFWLYNGLWVRWGLGLLGFVLLAYAGWSGLQLVIMYRAASTDPFVVARMGPGLAVVAAGAFVIFGTLFLVE